MARYLKDSRALFQHVPRTGGTFVEEALVRLGVGHERWLKKQRQGMPMKHALLSHYLPMHRCRAGFVFAFVRHPVSWYLSMWRYLSDAYRSRRRGSIIRGIWPDSRWDWHPMHVPAQLYHTEFPVWVERMVHEHPMYATRLFELYTGPAGGEFCNFIGRTESLVPDFVEVMGRLGYRTRGWREQLELVGKINTTKTPRLQPASQTTSLICESERFLIQRFYGDTTRDKRWYGLDSLQHSV